MYFFTYKEFIKRRHDIYVWYHSLPKRSKRSFKDYVYELWIDDDSKDKIWEYLHNDISNNNLKKHFRKVRTL